MQWLKSNAEFQPWVLPWAELDNYFTMSYKLYFHLQELKCSLDFLQLHGFANLCTECDTCRLTDSFPKKQYFTNFFLHHIFTVHNVFLRLAPSTCFHRILTYILVLFSNLSKLILNSKLALEYVVSLPQLCIITDLINLVCALPSRLIKGK